MEVLCEFATWQPVPGHEHPAGPFTGGAAKILHHTTEGSSFGGAFETYKKTGDFPHFTDSFEGGTYRAWQHLRIDEAASALEHRRGTAPTNTDNVIQIEHVGFTASSSSWPIEYLDGIARLCRWIEAQTGCLPVAIAGFGPGARRLSVAEWHSTSGHCGHMHAPNNSHVDPGALNIARILASSAPVPPAPAPSVPPLQLPGDDDMAQLLTVPTDQLDDKGNGWLLFDGATLRAPAVRWESVRSVEVLGSFPPTDGYWPLPRVGRQNRGGWLCVEVQGGAPRQEATLLVTVAD